MYNRKTYLNQGSYIYIYQMEWALFKTNKSAYTAKSRQQKHRKYNINNHSHSFWKYAYKKVIWHIHTILLQFSWGHAENCAALTRHVQVVRPGVIFAINSSSMLTGEIFSWKIRHEITTFWGWKPYKKNIEPYQNFAGFY